MRWAQVIDGQVHQRIVWDGQGTPPLPNLVPAVEAVGLPDYVAPAPVVVPQQVYGHQMRAVLRTRTYGDPAEPLLDVVLGLVEQLPEPQRSITRDSLLTAAVMRRDSPAVAAFSAVLGLGADYIDGLYIEAERVRV